MNNDTESIKGKACVDCGEPATVWSLTKETHGRYDPRCTYHHVAYVKGVPVDVPPTVVEVRQSVDAQVDLPDVPMLTSSAPMTSSAVHDAVHELSGAPAPVTIPIVVSEPVTLESVRASVTAQRDLPTMIERVRRAAQEMESGALPDPLAMLVPASIVEPSEPVTLEGVRTFVEENIDLAPLPSYDGADKLTTDEVQAAVRRLGGP